ncbi:MAG: hypothetical protein H6898_07885 [Rhodobacter sp.]|nr:hypothetical protein [Rhodobacter sp.]
MRAILLALMLLSTCVSACVPAQLVSEAPATAETMPPPEEQPDAPAEDPATEPAEAVAVEALAPLPPPDPPMLAQQRAACQREGGQLMPRGGGFFACVRPTRDAGRHCTAARDCEGLCLARSSTCAPLHPLYGCQEVFTLPGRRETLCTD